MKDGLHNDATVLQWLAYFIGIVLLIAAGTATFAAFWTGEWRYLAIPGILYAMTRY